MIKFPFHNPLHTPFRGTLIFFVWVSTILCSCQEQPSRLSLILKENPQIDVWVKDGRVYNGKNDFGQFQVLLRGDSILYVGKIKDEVFEAKKIIDAEGKTVAPGFIDIHAHGDPLRTPEFHNFLSMGVTTIVLGQDGYHPPVPELPEWMEQVQEKQPSVNVAMFVGHNTLREKSGIGFKENPSDQEIAHMSEMLAQALEQGCFGMSTGLEYTPGIYAPLYELEALAEVVGKYDRMISSHMRNEDDDQLKRSLNELLTQGRHCRVNVSHFKSVYGKGSDRAKELRAVLDSARKEGIYVTADIYPYNASYTTIGIVFPKWARPPYNFARVVKERRPELETYLRKRIAQRNGPEATLFGTNRFKGKTLEMVSTEMGKPFEDVLIDHVTPTGASGAYFVMNEELQDYLLLDSLTMVASDGSPTMRHPRGHGTFAKIIEGHVNQKALLSLGEAIYKMSELPAKTLGLGNRGSITEGKKADILIFDPPGVIAKANYEDPYHMAEGFDWVFVNGKIAKNPEGISEVRFGQVLRKNGKK